MFTSIARSGFKWSLVSGLLGLIAFARLAQTQPPETSQQPDNFSPSRDGGVREVLESIVIPPISSAPFTATLQTEWVKYAGEGATITLVNERHIARDTKGRIYQERWYLVPKYGTAKSAMNWIQISDPNQRTLYNCSTERHVCELKPYDPTQELSAARLHPPIPSGIAQHNQTTVEDLGTRNIAGVDTVGQRETKNIEIGTIGNDQPLTAMNETWHSQELGINLLSIRTSPSFGKQIFTITELSASEPDPHFFELPVGYKLIDVRKNSPMSW